VFDLKVKNAIRELRFDKKGLTYLIFGLRGVGKTTFSIAIFLELLKNGFKPVLDLILFPRNVRILSKFIQFDKTNRNLNKFLFLTQYDEYYKVRLRRLRFMTEQIVSRDKKITHIIIDDFFIPEYYYELLNYGKAFKYLSYLLTYLTILKKFGVTILLNVREDINNLLPILSKTLIAHSDFLIRLRKSRRIREIFAITLNSNIIDNLMIQYDPKEFFISGIKAIKKYILFIRENKVALIQPREG